MILEYRCIFWFAAGQNTGSRELSCDFNCEIRTGEDSDGMGRKIFDQDLAHSFAGAVFNSFCAAEQNCLMIAESFAETGGHGTERD